jgi:hypothetical protein
MREKEPEDRRFQRLAPSQFQKKKVNHKEHIEHKRSHKTIPKRARVPSIKEALLTLRRCVDHL